MKRVIQTAILGLVILVLQGNVPPPQISTNANPCKSLGVQSNFLFTYSWYEDEDFSLYTGYNSAVNTEVQRLRDENPSYIFSSTPGTGLIQYEWGMHPFLVPAVIYSNMNY